MTDFGPQLDEILELFGRLGIEVRMERLGGAGGGLCKVRGGRVLFVDAEADLATTMERCLKALADLPEVESFYLPPSLREGLERRRNDSPTTD